MNAESACPAIPLECGGELHHGAGDTHTMSDITRILHSIDDGDPKATDQLLPLVYEELRKLAAQKMANEAAGQTLQPTALVHEAWLRLAGGESQQWDGRGHFFAAAAESMRRILIERARRKNALKRGVDFERVNLDDVDVAVLADGDKLILINDALEKLEKEDPDAAQVVKLRFFAGLTNEEAGQALGISVRTAKRYWTFARAWLFQELRETTGHATESGT
jgi:RNA polymerase sigma factor (TIGR02999 family)